MEDVQYGGRLIQGAREGGGNVKVRTLSGTRAVLSQKCDGCRNGVAGKMAGSVAGGMSGGMAWLEEHLL